MSKKHKKNKGSMRKEQTSPNKGKKMKKEFKLNPKGEKRFDILPPKFVITTNHPQ
jgi:hypothetical protein